MSLLYALTGCAFIAGCFGVGYFTCVLISRAFDAHDRGMERVRRAKR